MAIVASLLLVISNIALIAADLAAIGSGFDPVKGPSWLWPMHLHKNTSSVWQPSHD